MSRSSKITNDVRCLRLLVVSLAAISAPNSAKADAPTAPPSRVETCGRTYCARLIHRTCRATKHSGTCEDSLVLRRADQKDNLLWKRPIPQLMQPLFVTDRGVVVMVPASGRLLEKYNAKEIVISLVQRDRRIDLSLADLFPEEKGRLTVSHYQWCSQVGIDSRNSEVWIQSGDGTEWLGLDALSGSRLAEQSPPPRLLAAVP